MEFSRTAVSRDDAHAPIADAAACELTLTRDPAPCAAPGAKGPPTGAHLDRIAAARLAAYHRVTPGDRPPHEAPVTDG
ncbi:hypothetical protein [Streptomyces sp. UNOB3_S3]|uniref:hypothetical protein n=1 Tax=Streptomyces sp. UNOB3_S3 TaxID=2871682 RepID=UPI001E5FE864|nr:hypothetical protein [Streptomyces sp. UNOB3_S3]MCC3774132.1 hypothetical protein [Streptomyces sp. UNOB3_S3]